MPIESAESALITTHVGSAVDCLGQLHGIGSGGNRRDASDLRAHVELKSARLGLRGGSGKAVAGQDVLSVHGDFSNEKGATAKGRPDQG
jgi:hypothetical protein